MSEISATQAGLDGIRRNLEQFDRAAARLSGAPRTGDLAADLVDLQTAKYGVQIGVKVVRAADELVGSLLDVIR